MMIWNLLILCVISAITLPARQRHVLPKKAALRFLGRFRRSNRDIRNECCGEDGCKVEEIDENKLVHGRQRTDEYMCQLAVDQGRRCQCQQNSTSALQACDTKYCSINGGWTLWAQWSSCSKSCGQGQQNCVRSCSNPTPKRNGANCDGLSDQRQWCNPQPCPVHGSWSSWSKSQPCSKACGTGTAQQSRTCGNPRPANGGRQCPGSDSRTVPCKIKECPCAAFYTDQVCPPTADNSACLFHKTSLAITRVSKVNEARIYAEAGLEVGLFTIASAGAEYVFRNSIHKEVVVRNEVYILMRSGTLLCRFQEVRDNVCGQPTYNYLEMTSGITKCTQLPVCSSNQQRRCIPDDPPPRSRTTPDDARFLKSNPTCVIGAAAFAIRYFYCQ